MEPPMAGAGYSVDQAFTDDETFEWSLALSSAGDDPIIWDDYRAEYTLTREGCSIARMSDESAGGIEASEIDGELILTISDQSLKLRPGTYRHGLRLVEIETGRETQIFDGTVTITEGNFR